jgi:hypothetical protein
MAPVADATATFIRNIEAATGEKISEWIRVARSAGFSKHGEDLLTAQYSGKRGALEPLYEALVKLAKSLGDDVEIAPKKNNVSIRRHKQFALLQPSTADRIVVGLILKGVKPAGRLEASGSFNAMFTHRVRVTDRKDIDAEFKAWLKKAYSEA